MIGAPRPNRPSMATSRDIEEVVTKLSSDKAKSREEGVKLLSSWLEGERAFGFCRLLAKNTARMSPNEIPRADTWPFLLTLLVKCIALEISASKKRPPKLVSAKTLRIAIQCAEDPKFGGKALLLLSVVKQLFLHILDVIKDVPSFQSEYSSILRHLLTVKEYRYQMRKRVYCSLIMLHINKVEMAICRKAIHSSSKEELFLCLLTLHALFENPPGDYPDSIREDVVKGFIDIFSNIRDEGKISRKLMECVNAYMTKDGPNLGCKAMEIHSAVQEFMFRCWLTTHDRGLKSSFTVYARVQLRLYRSTPGGSAIIEQLFDVVSKELEQCSVASTNAIWSESSRDDKVGSSGSSHQGLMDLAAAVFYQACTNMTKITHQEKRLKMENAAIRIKDGLMKRLWLWNGAFCFLIRNYGYRIDKSLLIDWFEGTCDCLQRIVNNTTIASSYDSLLWLLRALQEMSLLVTLSSSKEPSDGQSLTSSEIKLVRGNWNAVWSCVMHALPILINATPVVDAALALLGNMILREQIGRVVVPQDIWDLRIFMHLPSSSVLYFMSCYFSRKGVQGDIRDVLFLRRNLLRASLKSVTVKEPTCANEQSAILIPAAAFSLSAGCAPFLPPSVGKPALLDANEDCIMFSTEEVDHIFLHEVEISVEALSEISETRNNTSVEVKTEQHHTIRLPRQVRESLFHEMEEFINGLVNSDAVQTMIFIDLINFCCLLCTWFYSFMVSRLREEKLACANKLFDYILKSVDLVVTVIDEKCNDIQCRGCSVFTTSFDASGSTLASIKTLISSPLFSLSKDKYVDPELHSLLIKTIEKLLVALVRLFSVVSCTSYSGSSIYELPPSSDSIQECGLIEGSSANIVDMELDVDDGTKDADPLGPSGINNLATSFSPSQWKLMLVSAISTFSPVSPHLTWETLLDLVGKETDAKVSECMLYILCKYFPGSAESFSSLVSLLKTAIDKSAVINVSCLNILIAIRAFLGTLLSMSSKRKLSDKKYGRDSAMSEENLESLGDLLNEAADAGLPDWFARTKLIDCICCFVSLEPRIAQAMIGRLLVMLQDSDYRVRLFLARNIGVLFQTWDGHDELFHDICSNFGFEMVRYSKEKLVKAPEVRDAVDLSSLAMETALITLAHIALFSEEVEVEAVFMMCVVAAMESCQRKLVYALLDNLSTRLQYASRMKYLEELRGSIFARWVACEVSLLTLLEVQDLFIITLNTKLFLEHCCPWLLPPLVLRKDISNLNLVSKVTSKPLSVLAKEYFVPIFAVCMAVHCSSEPGKEKDSMVVFNSILQSAEISELERDNLIKRNMVSILSFLMALTSFTAEPAVPYFTKNVVVSSVKTIVDGFLDIDEHPTEFFVVDKINVFRADRVFKFLLEMHFQITAAIHPRHKRHRLFAIEVLIYIIGHRAAVSSTSNYVINIVGQYIGNKYLQDKCCDIFSTLLEVFKVNPKKEVGQVLGEQLQLLVSKLVACCILSEDQEAKSVPSSRVISLLHQLTVDADPSLHDYIRELEPFPELDCLERVKVFHEDLCKAYSTRDRFLMFVKRSNSLPQGLLLWSLRSLHRNLREIITQETKYVNDSGESSSWNCHPEVVTAVWTLVGLCGSSETKEMGGLLSDFISRVGIEDPYRVVFHLPKSLGQKHLLEPSSNEGSKEAISYNDTSVSEPLLITLLGLLKKYLLDDSVETMDITSRTLQGILSTEKGHRALSSLDSYSRSLMEVHSKGVNLQVVESLILDSEKNCHGILLEDSSIWSTASKNYETWICSLLHSLIGLCDDTILRLCRDLVLLKAEVAELLFENVFVNLAGRKLDVCQLISSKVQEYIFTDSNSLLKSIQLFLNAMNRLRSFHVMEKASSSSTSTRHAKPSRNSMTRASSGKQKDRLSYGLESSLWQKVYWFSIDYLLVAKAAILCGSYFTSIMYVEHWCEEKFNGLTLGSPDFSYMEVMPQHIELLVSAVTQINEPDNIYGIIRSHKLTSQLTIYEHEGNWSKALECYDLLVRSPAVEQIALSGKASASYHFTSYDKEEKTHSWKYYKGLMKSLQKNGCTHVLDKYCQGLTGQIGHLQNDSEFTEFQYEAAWRAGNWDFSLLSSEENTPNLKQLITPFNENLHNCFRALQEGDADEFHTKLVDSKKELVSSISHSSKESTQYIYSTIVKLQILDHLGMAWDLRWKPYQLKQRSSTSVNKILPQPIIPTKFQMELLNADWSFVLGKAQLHLNLMEPFIAFRRVMLQILGCKECMTDHLLQSASTLRKGSRFSLATAALHELKLLYCQSERQPSPRYFLARLEEAKILRAQGQHEMAISLAKYILENGIIGEEASNVHRLVGKWLAETRSSNSRTILEQYLKRSVELNDLSNNKDEACISRQCQTYFHLAHYTDILFRSYEERLASSEWQAAMRLRKHKTKELDALIKRLKSSSKGEKTDYSIKIQELQKQLMIDREEAERLQDDRDHFLSLALEGYQRSLVLGGKYDLRVVFRLVSLWFNLYTRQNVVKAMHNTVKEVKSYKFIPLVYQIASRLGSSKDGQGSIGFQVALVSLLKKMAIDHPYHTMFQLLALANGDRIKDKQRSRNSFVVDMDKKVAAENLLNELLSYHGEIIRQMKKMVDIYIKLAELETKKEETNRKIPLPREIRSVRQLELVPVVTATIPVDPSCQYKEGSFPHFRGLSDSVLIMNGINAPKVVECFGSDGHKYRQLAKSGNDDLRQDAVMEQFFGLVNNFLQHHRDTWKRRLGIRTYKVVPFSPSAGVLEWVDRTVPLGEYLLGSTRNGGAHARYGIGDWSFLQCREHMTNAKDKQKAFLEVCENFRPVMHYFFLERFLQPADWFENRLAYTRSVATSSMVGYIVGLGDRHSMNILIDQATAEVVHIDLGVAFEQGLMLKTPERVPFRLTRDMIDGMGVTGVEGVFRRCCEETISVMRTNKEALLTIIEVFIHDPLYKWALSPLKALQRQKETEEDTDSGLENSQDEYEGNKDAARATLRVKQKLDGYEEGEMRSVQGQVQQLIQDAIDTDRLCQMFPGWGAWL